MYHVILLPFRIGFTVNTPTLNDYAPDIVAEVFFIIDMVLKMKCFTFTIGVKEFFDPKLISKRYFNKYFIVDLTAIFPYELIVVLFIPDRLDLLPWSSVPHLLRLVHLSDIQKRILFHFT